MKQKQKPLSFSLNPLNIEYIESVVSQQKEVNSRYSRSMYMDDLITHLRTKAESKPNQNVSIPHRVTKTEMVAVKPKRKVFTPPTVEQVREYCDSRCNNVDPEKFVSHYNTNGWTRGKAETKIKCWKSCVQTWEGNDKPVVKVNESLGGKW